MNYKKISYYIKMPKTNYKNTVIYKICCKNLNILYVYVGETTDYIGRKASHKFNCNNKDSIHHHLKLYQTIRENGGWKNWKIIKLENYPCSNYLEATQRERYWCEKLNSNLNMVVPFLSKKEKRKTKVD